MIKLELPGDPTAQARVRIFKRGPKVMCFDPQTSFKRDLKLQVLDQLEDLS